MNISRHAAVVTRLMHSLLSSLRHYNGQPVCQLFSNPDHGPIVAFDLVSANCNQIGFASFEKVSSLRNFALRTGALCNPGGVQKYLNIQNWEVERNFKRGRFCGNDFDVMEGKNTGVIRVSFGASSTVEDVCTFVDFIRELYVEKQSVPTAPITLMTLQSIYLCTSLI